MYHTKSLIIARFGALLQLVVGAALLVSQVQGLEQFRYLDILNQKPRHTSGTRTTEKDAASNGDNDVEELYMTQRLDHFDPLNLKTYQQRYFVSNRYRVENAAETVTFLCVGGEGPGFDKSVLVDSVHCTGDMLELAHRLSHSYGINVVAYALEHRYYGKSYPNFGGDDNDEKSSSPVTTQNLKYLSSRQALEDLAHFVRSISQQQESKSRWVTFGGSYPGFMAGNARLKYPHLIFAAVSSSAPLDLKVDFPEYNRRVGSDLKYSKIGGSDLCFDIVKQGHEQAVALVNNGSTSELAKKFNVCNPNTALLEIDDQKLLLGDGLIGVYAQGNDPSCNEDDICNIERLCNYITEQATDDAATTTALDILADVAKKQRGSSNECTTVDWEESLKELSQPTVSSGGWRSWLWQTCTEVGFYQTCDDTCPWASFYHLVDMDLEICRVAYNITNVYDNVQATRDHYGGLDISGGSRVLSINGDVDPWSVLGLQESPKYSLPVEMVKGASHHFWTHAVQDTDTPEIVQVRKYIYSVVMDWLDIEEETSYSMSLRGGQAISTI